MREPLRTWHGCNYTKAMSKNIDDLIRESDEALRRIETLEAKRRSASSGKGFIERILRHSAQNSHHLVPIALAGGLVGLSLVRYHEKYVHRETIQELEEKIQDLKVDVETLRDKGTKLSQAVQNSLANNSSSWWKSSSPLELQKALDTYHGKSERDDPLEPVKSLPSPTPSSSPGKKPRPFI